MRSKGSNVSDGNGTAWVLLAKGFFRYFLNEKSASKWNSALTFTGAVFGRPPVSRRPRFRPYPLELAGFLSFSAGRGRLSLRVPRKGRRRRGCPAEPRM